MRGAFAIIVVVVAAAHADVISIRRCDNVSEDACNISELRITPCRETKSCKLRKGKDYQVSFDFVPNFDATKVKTGAYWANGAIDVPFAEVNGVDACTFTSCPLEVKKSQQLNYNLHIGKKFPSGVFQTKWKVWNEDDESQMCCFLTTIEIRK